MIKTFVGFSETGLDVAVRGAYEDLHEFMSKGIDGLNYTVMSTTTNVVLPPNNDWNAEYWFTITIQID